MRNFKPVKLLWIGYLGRRRSLAFQSIKRDEIMVFSIPVVDGCGGAMLLEFPEARQTASWGS
jgi:hypothetical protein